MCHKIITSKSAVSAFLICLLISSFWGEALGSDFENLEKQCRDIEVFLQSGQIEQAKTALTGLQQDYRSQPEYVKELQKLGSSFVGVGQYQTALKIYRDLQDAFPDHEQVVSLQRSIVGTYLEKGDTEKALQAAEKLKNDFPSHPDYDHQMEELTDDLILNNQPKAAKDMCKALLQQFPEHNRTIWYLHNRVRCEIAMGRPKSAEATIETIQSNYSSNPGYAEALGYIAYNYCENGFYHHAKNLYELVLDLQPGENIQIRCISGIARSDLNMDNYSIALRIYRKLLERYPEHEFAASFQRLITRAYLERGDKEKALQAAEKLKNDFPSHPDYAHQMEELTDDLILNNQPKAAKDMCKALLQQFPEHKRTIWYLHNKARSEIAMGSLEVAEVTIDSIERQCSSNPAYPEALSYIAYNYGERGYSKRARKLYESVLAMNPNSEIRLKCIGGIARSYVKSGDDSKVQEKVDYLMRNFNDNPEGIVFELNVIMENYFGAGLSEKTEKKAMPFFKKAIQIAELRLNKYPDIRLNKNDEVRFYSCLGDCYREIGKYTEAVECYKTILEDYPDSKDVWHYEFIIGHIYENMAMDGLVSESKANPIIREAYTKVVNQYPDCKAAKAAQFWLDHN